MTRLSRMGIHFTEPTTPIYIGGWSMWCPVCKSIDFNHDHPGVFEIIGKDAIIPTAEEHNWLVRHHAGKQYNLYTPSKIGYVKSGTKFEFVKPNVPSASVPA